jgi:hypothetical protein
MDVTERLSIPLLSAGQAQKELFHNEALQLLDSLVAPAVEDGPANDPPANPAIGQCYLIGEAPTGEWSGYAAHLAAYTSAGWRFIPPTSGMALFVKSTSTVATFSSAGWEIGMLRGSKLLIDGEQVVGSRGAAIADPSGGSSVDVEGRAAIGSILAILRQHGLISS